MSNRNNALLIQRVILFSVLFVIISGLLGARIINGLILYRYHFTIYGSLGKAFLFAAVAFGILAFKKLSMLQLAPPKNHGAWWLAASAILFALAWRGITMLIHGNSVSIWAVVTHMALLSCIASLGLGCFGFQNTRTIAKACQRELLLTGLLTVAFTGFLYVAYSLWPVFAAAVLHSVQALLALCGIHSAVIPPRSLLFDKFEIEIAQYCSGIESIALFSGLYAVVGLVDRHQLNYRRYSAVLLPALIILFGLNILRVFVLILAGYYINPQIAFSLFHTYAGMVFFIIYAALFWAICYRYLLRRPVSL